MGGTNISGMDLNLLVALDALLTEKHVSRAAERLGTSQSSLSRSLSELRRWFDDPLLLRGQHGMTPTPRAIALRSEVRGVLERIEAMVKGRDTFDPATSQRVFRVAVTEYPQCVLFPALLSRFKEVAPGVNVVAEHFSFSFADALTSGAMELAMAPTGDPPAALRSEDVLADRMCCVMRKGHPASRERLSLSRFVELPHLQISPQGQDRSAVDDLPAEKGLSRRIALRVPSFAAAPLLVAESDLIALIPTLLVQRFAAPMGLVVHPPPLDLPGIVLRQTWHARADEDAGIRWLRAEVRAVGAALSLPPSRRTARLSLGRRKPHSL